MGTVKVVSHGDRQGFVTWRQTRFCHMETDKVFDLPGTVQPLPRPIAGGYHTHQVCLKAWLIQLASLMAVGGTPCAKRSERVGHEISIE